MIRRSNYHYKIAITIVAVLFTGMCFSGCKDKQDAPPSASVSSQQEQVSDSTKASEKSVLAKILGTTDGSDTAKKEYVETTASALMDDLNTNALRAKKKYNNRNVAIKNAKIDVIDSNGDYFTVCPPEVDVQIIPILINIQSEKQREQLSNMDVGQIVTVYGTVTHVGESMGYAIDLDNFEEQIIKKNRVLLPSSFYFIESQ